MPAGFNSQVPYARVASMIGYAAGFYPVEQGSSPWRPTVLSGRVPIG